MNNNWFELVIGVLLLIGGIVGVIQKRFSVAIGRSSSSPEITLTQSRAVFFSRFCMVEGTIIVALWFRAFTGDEILGRWLGGVTGAALIIALLVFAVCAFYEITEPLIVKNKEGKKKKRSE